MNKPWMPVVAGILDIVSGAMGVLMGLGMSLYLTFAGAIQAAPGGVSRFGPHLGSFPHLPSALFPGNGPGYRHNAGSTGRTGNSRRSLCPENKGLGPGARRLHRCCVDRTPPGCDSADIHSAGT